MLERVIDGVGRASVDRIVVAVPHPIPMDLGVDVFMGSEEDVLDRYYQCAKKYKADTVIRITSDCPLISSYMIDVCLRTYKLNKYDFVYFDVSGLDVEVMSFSVLDEAHKRATLPYDREHVTPYIRKHMKCLNLRDMKLSVDTREDLDKLRKYSDLMGGRKW